MESTRSKPVGIDRSKIDFIFDQLQLSTADIKNRGLALLHIGSYHLGHFLQPKRLSATSNLQSPMPEEDKPVQLTPIPGSKWAVVWTSMGRAFFHDRAAGTSVWTMPGELVGREDACYMAR